MRRNLMTVLALGLALSCMAERATAQEKKPDAAKAPKPAARPLQMAPIRTTAPSPTAAVPARAWVVVKTSPFPVASMAAPMTSGHGLT
jgi:hypothetical protein